MARVFGLILVVFVLCSNVVHANTMAASNDDGSSMKPRSRDASTSASVLSSSSNMSNLTARDDPPQAPPPPYVWQDFMYFEDGFPPEQHEYAVISAFIDTLRLALAGVQTITSLETRQNTPAGASSSFLRYFNDRNPSKVRAMLTNILAVLGLPEAERQCELQPRLPLLYDDAWNPARHCLNQPDLRAYMVAGDNPGESFMNICPYFFENYRRIDEIQCNTLGNSAENGFPERTGMWSSGSTLLHEFLHWTDMNYAQVGMPIVDQVITRPSGRQTKAYGPYYSWLLNENQLFDPLSNDDNYVYFAQEAFWSSECPEKAVWEDPPDLGQIYDPNRIQQ